MLINEPSFLEDSLSTKAGLSTKRIYFSLLKSMITTGILYQPRSFYLGGLLYSSITCVIVGYLTLVCMAWLSKANDKTGGTYSDIAGKAMGPKGIYLLDSIIFITQFGPGAINVGFIIDLLLTALSMLGIYTSEYILMLFLLFFLIPLCLIKSIQDQSLAHITADFIIVSSILTIGIYSSVNSSSEDISIITPQNMVYTLGTLVYGFEGIPLLLPIKEVMQVPTEFSKVLSYMIATIVVIFVWFSCVSNFAYGSDLEDIVILNLPSSAWVAVMLFGYSLAVMLTMPLVLNPVFTISEKYLKVSGNRSYFSRAGFVLVIVIVGTAARNYLGLCVSVIGGLFSSPLAFIFPAVINLKINAESERERVFSWIMIVVGIFFGVAAIFSTLYFTIASS